MSKVVKLSEVTAIKAEYKPSTQEIAERVNNGTMVFDNVSQRGPVWDVSRKSCLIRTILRNGDVPSANARDEDRNGVKVLSVIEGQQRMRAVTEYLNGNFALELGDFNCIFCYKGKEMELEGKHFDDLPQEFQDKIRNFIFTINYYTNLSDSDANEMFYFSNNGKPVASEQQMWSVVKCKREIENIGQNNEIFVKILNQKKMSNYEYRFLIMRCIYMLHNTDSGLEKKDLMPFFMEFDIKASEVKQIMRVFKLMNETYDEILSHTDLTKTRMNKIKSKFGNKTHFVIFFALFNRALSEKRKKKDLADWVIKFFDHKTDTTASPAYNMATRQSVLKAVNVTKRLEAMSKHYDTFFQGKEDSLDEADVKEQPTVEITETVKESSTEVTEDE